MGRVGFRVPAIVVSNLAPAAPVVHEGPFEHCSTLALIESTFGLQPLTARDANARNLREVLRPWPRRPVRPGVIPTSSQVPGPASDAAAACSASSVQSVSPAPVRSGMHPPSPHKHWPSGYPSGSGMARFGREHRKDQTS